MIPNAQRQRLAALDATRGVLALVVVASHTAAAAGGSWMVGPSHVAVLVFFMMSGYVLARADDGHYGLFLLRRALRLWPLYAVCIVGGHALLRHDLPTVRELLWWPDGTPVPGMVDPPAWSLYIEAWATPVLPAMFALSRRRAGSVLLLAGLVLAVAFGPGQSFFALMFAIGVAAARLPLRWPDRMPAPLLWLGKVSYSLYLSHDVLLHACGPIVGLALALPMAWALWRVVEQPSIRWSRTVAKRAPEHRWNCQTEKRLTSV